MLRRRVVQAGLLLSLLTGLIAGCSSETYDPLPKLGANITQTSLSGLSAGAYMAGQFQLAHSRLVLGAGIIAGGPYGCGQSQHTENMAGPGVAFINMGKAINGCMKDSLRLAGIPNVQRLAEMARDLSNTSKIDPLPQVWKHRVYLYSANADQTVVQSIVSSAQEFYKAVGVPHDQIVFLHNQSGAHAFITREAGRPCGESGKPYINACAYDQAGAVLKHIRGDLKPAVKAPAERFMTFDQQPFTHGISKHNMAPSGTIYIPSKCQFGAACAVHIVFHGCGQSEILSEVAWQSGYAEWGEANNLIVLFPRAALSTVNPAACWDWWGYTGADYLTKAGPQIRVVRAMLDHLAGRPES